MIEEGMNRRQDGELVLGFALASLNPRLVVGIDVFKFGCEPNDALEEGNDCTESGGIESRKPD